MRSTLLGLLMFSACNVGFAKELCAVESGETFASRPSDSQPAKKSPLRIQKGKSYDVGPAKDGWATVTSGGQEVWARPWLFASSCNPATGGSAKVGSPKGQSSAAPRKNLSSSPSSGCPCGGGNVCVGPRGGRYCITSGGNKRYGV